MKSKTFIPVVYEDDEIIVVNKKSGLASQGGAGVGRSVDSDLSDQIGQKVFLCHRLDKDTSGLLLCAKSSAAANKWSRLVGEKSVKKEYLALCFGTPKSQSGKITLPIKEKGQSKSAMTLYEREKLPDFLEEEAKASRLDVCLMRLTLATGRTHQIRIHLAQSGLPIIGDDKYGDFGLNKAAKRDMGLKRLCLCAFRLTLPLSTGQRSFEIQPEFLPGMDT